MKAIQLTENGGSDVLQLREVPTPEPKEGELLMKVDAAGLNFIDVYQRDGMYPIALPFILGMEGAGTIEAVGAGVSGFRAGDRAAVGGALVGSYAEYAIVPEGRAVKCPDGMDTKTAAALMLQGMTAHYLCCDTYPVQPGDWTLVHAAAGGMGLLLTQMIKMRGGKVIGTVSTEEKAQLAREAGADEVVLYTQQDFEAETQRITGGEGVAVVYDSVAKTTFDKGLNVLRPRGTMALYGQSSGKIDPIDPAILAAKGSLFLTRPTLASYIAKREELEKRASDIMGWVKAGKLNVRIGATYPLAEAKAAHDALEGRKTTGKVLLIP